MKKIREKISKYKRHKHIWIFKKKYKGGGARFECSLCLGVKVDLVDKAINKRTTYISIPIWTVKTYK